MQHRYRFTWLFAFLMLLLLAAVGPVFAQAEGGQRLNGRAAVEAETPQQLILEQNFPNPFNPATSIRFSVPRLTSVSLKVYNLLGKEVATLVNGEMPAGTYTIAFEAGNLPSGYYIYRLIAGSQVLTRKMTLLK